MNGVGSGKTFRMSDHPDWLVIRSLLGAFYTPSLLDMVGQFGTQGRSILDNLTISFVRKVCDIHVEALLSRVTITASSEASVQPTLPGSTPPA